MEDTTRPDGIALGGGTHGPLDKEGENLAVSVQVTCSALCLLMVALVHIQKTEIYSSYSTFLMLLMTSSMAHCCLLAANEIS